MPKPSAFLCFVKISVEAGGLLSLRTVAMTGGTRVGNTFARSDSTLLPNRFPESQTPEPAPHPRYEKSPFPRKKHCPSAADIVSYWSIPYRSGHSGLDACATCFRGIPDAFFAQPWLLVRPAFLRPQHLAIAMPASLPPNSLLHKNPARQHCNRCAFLASRRKTLLH